MPLTRGNEFALDSVKGFPAEESQMQTVYPRYTMAERLVLAFVAVVTWPVERFLGWVRRKVAVDPAPSADRR
jgi:hypothetical protein